MKTALVVVAAVFLSGCGLAMQAKRQAAPHTLITDPLKVKNAQIAASQYIKNIMKDPESASFKYTYPPVYGLLLDLTTVNRQGTFLCAEVNGKNSYGGFTGFTPFLVYFANDDLTTVSDGTIESAGSNVVNHWCLTLYNPSAL
jgi:hypothetical protein